MLILWTENVLVRTLGLLTLNPFFDHDTLTSLCQYGEILQQIALLKVQSIKIKSELKV